MGDERYPDEATLVGIEADAHTGVEFIRTGQSPYYVEFRRLLWRLLEATRRANDLRVYQDGDLSIGVRGGRCVVQNAAIEVEGVGGVSVANNVTTHVWLDAAGEVQTGTEGLPTERTAFVPLAKVTSEAGAIASIEDLRGEAFLAVPSLPMLGVSTSAETIDAALAEADATSVTSAALNTLTGGTASPGDAYHQHTQMVRHGDSMESFTLVNDDDGDDANVAVAFALSGKLAFPTQLYPDTSSGWLKQQHGVTTRALVGAVQASYGHEGSLEGSQSGKLMGVVPIAGQVSAVVLSAGANLATSEDADHVEAVVKINGDAVTSVHPRLRSEDGTGFRCTDQGDGVAAEVKSDGTEQVSRGDVVTVDLTRTVSGSVTDEASDVAVLVVVRANEPE